MTPSPHDSPSFAPVVEGRGEDAVGGAAEDVGSTEGLEPSLERAGVGAAGAGSAGVDAAGVATAAPSVLVRVTGGSVGLPQASTIGKAQRSEQRE